MTSPAVRHRGDLCPGVLRPWPAQDGALVRLRLVGGQISPVSLAGLLEVATAYGEGAVHLTKRANLQLRALPATEGCLDGEVIAAIEATGLLPHPTHELVRNIMVSPLSGLLAADADPTARDLSESQAPDDCNPRNNGRADLRPVARALDEGLCAHPSLAALPGRFLFVLDDGRGDLVERSLDLGLVAVSGTECQLRLGSRAWGPVVPLDEAAARLVGLARAFLTVRGTGVSAAWHVDELSAPPEEHPRDPRTEVHSAPPGVGELGRGVEHVALTDGMLTRTLFEQLVEGSPDHFVVTPWQSILVCH